MRKEKYISPNSVDTYSVHVHTFCILHMLHVTMLHKEGKKNKKREINTLQLLPAHLYPALRSNPFPFVYLEKEVKNVK